MTAVLGNLREHLRLVTRMARATETDLVGAYEAGELSQEEWAEMVQTCRSCDWAGRCGDWLDDHDHVACAPATCLNRDRFEALQARAAARLGADQGEEV